MMDFRFLVVDTQFDSFSCLVHSVERLTTLMWLQKLDHLVELLFKKHKATKRELVKTISTVLHFSQRMIS